MATQYSNLKLYSDNELVDLYKDGYEPALAEIYLRYNKRILQWICKITHRTNIVAEDIVQDTFLRVALKINQYKGKGFTAWIHTIAQNSAFDFFNKEKKHLHEVFDNYHELVSLENPAEILETKERKVLYIKEIKQLDHKKLLVISLRFQKIDYKKIEDITGIKVSQAKSIMYRVFTKFKSL